MILPVLHSTNMTNVAVENESDLGKLRPPIPDGTQIYVRNTRTLWAFNPTDTSPAVAGQRVLANGGGAFICSGENLTGFIGYSDVSDITGNPLFIFGQNTDITHIGGSIVIAGGRGFDTNGVIIAERILGSNPFAYSQICAFFSQGGTIGQMSLSGGSANAFAFRADGGGGLSLVHFSAGLPTMYLYDAGINHLFRVSDGVTVGVNKRLEMNQTGLAFNGSVPITRPDYTITNPTTNRNIDVSAATLGQLREIIGTLLQDLINYGLLQ